jgi:hypothetical protein
MRHELIAVPARSLALHEPYALLPRLTHLRRLELRFTIEGNIRAIALPLVCAVPHEPSVASACLLYFRLVCPRHRLLLLLSGGVVRAEVSRLLCRQHDLAESIVAAWLYAPEGAVRVQRHRASRGVVVLHARLRLLLDFGGLGKRGGAAEPRLDVYIVTMPPQKFSDPPPRQPDVVHDEIAEATGLAHLRRLARRFSIERDAAEQTFGLITGVGPLGTRRILCSAVP